MDPFRRTAGRRLALLAACLLLVACGSSSPSPSPTASPSAPTASPGPATPTPDPAGVYAAIEAQVQQIRGLTAKKPVTPILLDAATLKKNMAASFTKDNPPDVLAANQQLMELMGLIPKGASLSDLYIQLLGSQVAGYYDPDTQQLYVVSKTGAVGPVEKVTFSHEFTHALQDQNFGLKNLALDAIGQGDASLAHLSVAEGDATMLMSLWAQAHLTPADMLALVQAGSDPEQTKILDAMPDILKETLLFPYTSGLSMVLAAQTSGGWPAVNAMYDRPPASTEQVLHADKYAAGEAPIAVTFPADLAKRLGTGWSVACRTRSVSSSSASGSSQPARSRRRRPRPRPPAGAAIGWLSSTTAIAWRPSIDTRWDTPADADEFADAATTTLHALDPDFQLIHLVGSDRVTCSSATARRSGPWRARSASRGSRPYICSGAEIPSSPRALARVVFAAATRASRAADRSGSAGSTTLASR